METRESQTQTAACIYTKKPHEQ